MARMARAADGGEAAPAISAVLPCRNEAGHIESAVRSVLAQVPPEGGYEVIVVDGMSDDGTREVLQRLAQEDARLRVLDNPRRITPVAMNLGILASRGRYIAIMGSHNRYAEDYLARAVAFLDRRPEVDNVGGSMFADGTTYVQKAVAVAFHHPFGVGGSRWHNPAWDGPSDTVFGGVYRREVFDRIGLFDETLVRNQDDELNLRLTRAGGVIWHTPELRSWYSPRRRLSQLFQQYRQYGYWKVPVIRKHRLPASPRHLVPAAFVLALLGLPSLALALGAAALAGAPTAGLALGTLAVGGGVAVSYIGANLLASVHAAAASGWRFLPVLPLVFGCLHVGYGVGFLEGLLASITGGTGAVQAQRELTR